MQGKRVPFAKTCLVSAIAIAMLAGCGGGGGGGGSKNGGSKPAQPVTLSGAAAKGIIKNGVVSIYGVSDGQRGSLLAQGRTSSEDGTYSLTVSGYSGPVIVEISAVESDDEQTLMVCDIPGTDSCGSGISFGGEYPLGSSFKLKAVVPAVNSGQAVTTNVTALTDLAANLAEKYGVTPDSVHIANSQVRSLFELAAGSDITKLPVVDVTNNEALQNADAEALKAALLSASILAAAKKDNPSSSIEEAVAAVAESFARNNGQFVNNEGTNTSTTTLAEILSEAETLIDQLPEVEALSGVASDIVANKGAAETAPEGSFTEAEPDEELLSDGFKKAKGLVQDLRDISTAASLERIRDGSTAFAQNLQVASDAINADAGRAVEALSLVASALAEAAVEKAAVGTYQAENGIVVTVASAAGVATYSFNGNVGISDDEGDHTLTVNLTSSGVFTVEENYTENEEESSWNDSGNSAIDANLTIEGVVENDAVRLTIGEGSSAIVSGFRENWGGSGSWDEQGNEWNDEDSLTVDTIDFDLKVALEQKTGDARVSFSGDFGVDVRGYAASSSYYDSYGCDLVDELLQCEGEGSESSTLTFSRLTLSLDGVFAYGGESFEAHLAVTAINNGYTLEETSSWSHFWRDYQDSQYNYDDSSSEETADKFVRVNFTLAMETQLAGISDEVSVTLKGDRQALRTGTASLGLRYEGKAIDANLVLTGSSNRAAALTITNNQGASLVLTESNIDNDVDELSGVINADGAQQAVVSDEDGIILIRYNGGYVESL